MAVDRLARSRGGTLLEALPDPVVLPAQEPGTGVVPVLDVEHSSGSEDPYDLAEKPGQVVRYDVGHDLDEQQDVEGIIRKRQFPGRISLPEKHRQVRVHSALDLLRDPDRFFDNLQPLDLRGPEESEQHAGKAVSAADLQEFLPPPADLLEDRPEDLQGLTVDGSPQFSPFLSLSEKEGDRVLHVHGALPRAAGSVGSTRAGRTEARNEPTVFGVHLVIQAQVPNESKLLRFRHAARSFAPDHVQVEGGHLPGQSLEGKAPDRGLPGRGAQP